MGRAVGYWQPRCFREAQAVLASVREPGWAAPPRGMKYPGVPPTEARGPVGLTSGGPGVPRLVSGGPFPPAGPQAGSRGRAPCALWAYMGDGAMGAVCVGGVATVTSDICGPSQCTRGSWRVRLPGGAGSGAGRPSRASCPPCLPGLSVGPWAPAAHACWFCVHPSRLGRP